MATESTDHARRRWSEALARRGLALAWLTFGLVAFLWITSLVFSTYRAGRLYDFAQEWTSVRNYQSGLPVYLDFAQSLERHIGGTANPTFSYNAHPPASILLALPFGLLEYPSAYLIWNIASLICLGLSLWMIVRIRRGNARDVSFLGLLVVVVFGNALTHQLVQGQLNLVILLLITAAWAADRKNAVAISGALIGLAAAIKLFPAFLVLYPLARRRWLAVGTAALTFLAVNGMAWFMFSGQAYADYFLRVAPELSKFRDALPNASLLGFWTKLLDGSLGEVVPVWHCPPLAKALGVACSLAAAAGTLYVMNRVARRSADAASCDTDQDLSFALCCAGMLLASPITWDHYFLLLIPGLWFAWCAYGGQAGAKTLVAVCAVLLMWVNPYSVWDRFLLEPGGPDGRPHPLSPAGFLTLASFQFYALLGFYLLVLGRLRCRMTRSPEVA
jgi:alpha-1,2-mannosyltransferase